MSDVTVTTETPPANDPAARTLDGTIKDVSPASTTPSSEPKAEPSGDSFLTSPKEPPKTPDTPKTPDAPKPEGEKKPDAVVGAPEKYADFKLPDGYKFDDKVLGEAQATFKKLNLTQEAGQQLVDLYAANALAAAKAPYDEYANLRTEWKGEIASRFPGEKSAQVKTMIASVIDAALPPSMAQNLRKALDLTGAGDHPDVVESLSILLKPLSEGTPVRGNGPTDDSQRAPTAGPASIADALYGHLRK